MCLQEQRRGSGGVVMATVSVRVPTIHVTRESEFEDAKLRNTNHRHIVFDMHFDKLVAQFFSALRWKALSLFAKPQQSHMPPLHL